MTLIPILRANTIELGNRWTRVAAIVALAMLLQGCAERRPHAAYPWATMTAVRPRVPLPAPGHVPPSIDEDVPDLHWEGPPPALNLVVARVPVRPRTANTPSAAESNVASKPEPLSLAPQLSPQEVAAAQQQMTEGISSAQSKLTAVKGRQLNAAQADLVSKINSFIEESRGAAREGDWNRAKNLAKKAQVLGEELTGSL